MRLYICGIQNISIMDGLSLVTAGRRERIHRFVRAADKQRCLVAGLLLRRFFGVKSEDTLAYGDKGKPYFKLGGPRFNLSHSGDYVVLATAASEVGVDVEKIEPYPDALAQRCFTPPEYAWLKRQDGMEAFYRLWTAKESVMKGAGLGLSMPPESFSVLPLERGAHKIGGDIWFFHWLPLDGHIVCRAVSGAEEATEVIYVQADELMKPPTANNK